MKWIGNILLAFILLSCLNLSAQQKNSVEVEQATLKFIAAFKAFDWNNFKNCFSKDATIFFPETYAKRVKGKKEIEAAWKEIFPEFIEKSKTFDLKLTPQNMLVQVYGSSAIVTFCMGEETNYLSRRTIIFVKEYQNWKIVHLHASGLKQ